MNAVVERPKRIEACMKVVECEMGLWYLLSDGEDFYLDIRTGLFGYAFWLLLKLNDNESDGYRWGGTAYIVALAKIVQERALTYFLRNEPVEKQAIVFAVIDEWQNDPRRHKAPP